MGKTLEKSVKTFVLNRIVEVASKVFNNKKIKKLSEKECSIFDELKRTIEEELPIEKQENAINLLLEYESSKNETAVLTANETALELFKDGLKMGKGDF